MDSIHALVNQREEVVLTTGKRTLFPPTHISDVSLGPIPVHHPAALSAHQLSGVQAFVCVCAVWLVCCGWVLSGCGSRRVQI